MRFPVKRASADERRSHEPFASTTRGPFKHANPRSVDDMTGNQELTGPQEPSTRAVPTLRLASGGGRANCQTALLDRSGDPMRHVREKVSAYGASFSLRATASEGRLFHDVLYSGRRPSLSTASRQIETTIVAKPWFR